MAIQTMYPAQVNSPQTELSAAITNAVTTIGVLDASLLPAAPNLAVIGSDETAETILYTGKSGNNLTGCTRGFQGTAKAWGAGVKVARNFTAYDYDSLRTNVVDNQSYLSQQPPVSVDLVPGIQSVTVPRDTPYNVLNIRGRTLVNILGRDGGCESLAPFSFTGSGGISELSTTQKRSGLYSLKITTSNNTRYALKDYSYPLDTTKQYVLGCWVYIESFTSGVLNLSIRDFGTSTSRYSATINTAVIGSWQFVYVKIPTSNTLVGSGFRFYIGATSTGTNATYFDEIRLYELSTADSNAIGTTLTTGAQIDAFIPYVDDIKPVYAPYVYKYGKNLLPPFSEWTLLHTNARVAQPYSIEQTSIAANELSYVTVDVVPNTEYRVSFTNVGMDMGAYTESVVSLAGSNWFSSQFSFNSGNNSRIRIYARSRTIGSLSLSNPQLELGTVATSFQPRNDDYLFFPDLRLHSNVDGTVYDQLYVDGNGQYRKLARYRETVLDGSLAWNFGSDYTGYKRVKVTASGSITSSANVFSTRYDGKVLTNIPSGAFTASDQVSIGANSECHVTIADTDSGWTETLNPNANASVALMNGWKANGNNGTVYNSWVSVLDGSAPPTNTEAYVSANKAPNWTGWGKLTYQLAQSDNTEIVVPEGDITLHEGANQIEVGNAVIVRERANPVYYATNDWYYINDQHMSSGTSKLRYRTARITSIYRNRVQDTKWTLFTGGNSYGLQECYIKASDYDPSAVYEVTYLALDTYALGIAPQSISGEYAPNMRGTVDGMARRQAEVVTRLSVLERSAPNKAQPQWIAPTLLNSWENSSAPVGYFKSDTGIVRIKGSIKSGVITYNTPLFILPAGYMPKESQGFAVRANNGSAEVMGSILVSSDGTVSILSGATQGTSINISFQAEL